MDCEKVKQLFPEINFGNCCESCHEDVEEGWGEDLFFLAPDGNLYFVCCNIGRKLEDDE